MPAPVPDVMPKQARGATPTPGSPEKTAVRSMFDRIAPRYDLLNRLLSAGRDVRWRRRAVDYLDLSPPARVLDLCTGTADLLLEALQRDPRTRGLGVDFSHPMLRLGAQKLRRARLEARGALVGGDAERLPVREGLFDGALVAFGIRNIGDPPVALREIRRALRPGGRFVVLEFSMPKGILRSAYRVYFRQVLPRIGGLISGDRSAYAYLPASVARFPSPEDFAALMRETGFVDVRWQLLTLGIACLFRGERPS